MVTRNWKNIVGAIYSGTTYNVNSGSVTRVPISGLFDIGGSQHSTLVTRIVTTNGSYANYYTAAGFNQASLFNCFSTNTNINTTENYSNWQLSGGKVKMVFGTGNTPAKYTDYKLENPITEGITGVDYYVAKSYNEDSNNYEAIITATFTSTINTTITEVGLVKSIFDNDNPSYVEYASYYYNVLAAREVLETPIEVKAGETFTVSIKIDI